ncbi:unnamed protein product, partial [Owenia fusiformis]
GTDATVGNFTVSKDDDNSITTSDGSGNTVTVTDTGDITDQDGNDLDLSSGDNTIVGGIIVTKVDSDTVVVSDDSDNELIITVVPDETTGTSDGSDSGGSSPITDSNGNSINLSNGQSSTVGDLTVAQTDDGTYVITDSSSGNTVTVTGSVVTDNNDNILYITPGGTQTTADGDFTVKHPGDDTYVVTATSDGSKIEITVPSTAVPEIVLSNRQGNEIDVSPSGSETIGDLTVSLSADGETFTISDGSSGGSIGVSGETITGSNGDAISISPGSTTQADGVSIKRVDDDTYVVSTGSPANDIIVTVPTTTVSGVTDQQGNTIDVSQGSPSTEGDITVTEVIPGTYRVVDGSSGSSVTISGTGVTSSTGNHVNLSPGGSKQFGDMTVRQLDSDSYVVSDGSSESEVTITVPAQPAGTVITNDAGNLIGVAPGVNASVGGMTVSKPDGNTHVFTDTNGDGVTISTAPGTPGAVITDNNGNNVDLSEGGSTTVGSLTIGKDDETTITVTDDSDNTVTITIPPPTSDGITVHAPYTPGGDIVIFDSNGNPITTDTGSGTGTGSESGTGSDITVTTETTEDGETEYHVHNPDGTEVIITEDDNGYLNVEVVTPKTSCSGNTGDLAGSCDGNTFNDIDSDLNSEEDISEACTNCLVEGDEDSTPFVYTYETPTGVTYEEPQNFNGSCICGFYLDDCCVTIVDTNTNDTHATTSIVNGTFTTYDGVQYDLDVRGEYEFYNNNNTNSSVHVRITPCGDTTCVSQTQVSTTDSDVVVHAPYTNDSDVVVFDGEGNPIDFSGDTCTSNCTSTSITSDDGSTIVSLTTGKEATVNDVTISRTGEDTYEVTDPSTGNGFTITTTITSDGITSTDITDTDGNSVDLSPGSSETIDGVTLTQVDDDTYTVSSGSSDSEITINVPTPTSTQEGTGSTTTITDGNGNPVNTSPGQSITTGDVTVSQPTDGTIVINDGSSDNSSITITDSGITGSDGNVINISPGSNTTSGNLTIVRIDEDTYVVVDSDGNEVTVTVTSPTETVITDSNGNKVNVSGESAATVGTLTVSQNADDTISVTDSGTGTTITVTPTGLTDNDGNSVNLSPGTTAVISGQTVIELMRTH